MKSIASLIEKVGVDKALHFLVGFALTALGYPFGTSTMYVLTGVSLAVGIVKEAYDQWDYGGWDWIDLGVTVLGSLLSLGWYVLSIHVLIYVV